MRHHTRATLSCKVLFSHPQSHLPTFIFPQEESRFADPRVQDTDAALEKNMLISYANGNITIFGCVPLSRGIQRHFLDHSHENIPSHFSLSMGYATTTTFSRQKNKRETLPTFVSRQPLRRPVIFKIRSRRGMSYNSQHADSFELVLYRTPLHPCRLARLLQVEKNSANVHPFNLLVCHLVGTKQTRFILQLAVQPVEHAQNPRRATEIEPPGESVFTSPSFEKIVC